MADDKHKSPEQAPRTGRVRRRPPPTIDLKATEIPAEPPKPEPAPAASSRPEPPPEPATAAPAAELPPDPAEPPGADRTPHASPPPPGAPVWLMLGAAAGGGVIVAIVMLLIWGIQPNQRETGQPTTQIEKLEAAVRELAAREAPAGADPRALAALSGRVAQLEATRSAPAPAEANVQLDGRLAAAERQIKSLSDQAAKLTQANEAAVAAAASAQRQATAAAARAETVQAAGVQGAVTDRQDIAALTTRLTALERAAQTLQSALAEQRSTLAKQHEVRSDDRTVRLAVLAEMLKAAVARSDLFRPELDAAKALAPDPAMLAPLEAFAETGVPTAAELGQRLRAILPAMRRAAAPEAASDGSFLKRLQVNAERLVRIQPVGEPSGDDADAMLARIAAKLDRGDVAGALAETKALPQAVRAPAESWIKTAQARNSAIDASRRFAAAAVAALAGRSD